MAQADVRMLGGKRSSVVGESSVRSIPSHWLITGFCQNDSGCPFDDLAEIGQCLTISIGLQFIRQIEKRMVVAQRVHQIHGRRQCPLDWFSIHKEAIIDDAAKDMAVNAEPLAKDACTDRAVGWALRWHSRQSVQ